MKAYNEHKIRIAAALLWQYENDKGFSSGKPRFKMAVCTMEFRNLYDDMEVPNF